MDSLTQSNSYFFSKFQFQGNGEDILRQDLGIHGIPILNYFDVKYVIIHKTEPISFTDQTTQHIPVEEETTSNVISRTSDLMSEILNQKRPYFEDDNLISYKIPESSSQKPFLLLGKGWHEVWWDIEMEEAQRGMYPESVIKIVNPGKDKTDFSMEIELMAYEQSRNIEIFFNEKYLSEVNIPSTAITLELNKLQLLPGENILSVRSDGFESFMDENFNKEMKVSLIGLKISGK